MAARGRGERRASAPLGLRARLARGLALGLALLALPAEEARAGALNVTAASDGGAGLGAGWEDASFRSNVQWNFPLASAAASISNAPLPPALAAANNTAVLVATEPYGGVSFREADGGGALAAAEALSFWLWVAPRDGSPPRLRLRLETEDPGQDRHVVVPLEQVLGRPLVPDTWTHVTADLAGLPRRDWRRVALQDASEKGSVLLLDDVALHAPGPPEPEPELARATSKSLRGGPTAGVLLDVAGPVELPGLPEAVLQEAARLPQLATDPVPLFTAAGGLAPGVVDWSWNTSYLLYEGAPGAAEITAAVNGWGGLSLKLEQPFSTDWWGNSALEFWIRVADPDVPLVVRFDASDQSTSLDAFTVTLDEMLRGTALAPLEWTHVVAPLDVLGPYQWDRVSFIVAEDGARDVLFNLKDVTLLPSDELRGIAPLESVKAYPLYDGDGTIPVYNERLHPGVVDWSWNGAYDFAHGLEEGGTGILADARPYGALSLKFSNPFNHGADGQAVEFWIKPLTPPLSPANASNLHLRLDAVEASSNSSTIVATLPLTKFEVQGEPLEVGAWSHIVAPLRSFGASPWDRVSWVDASGEGGRFVVDGVNVIDTWD